MQPDSSSARPAWRRLARRFGAVVITLNLAFGAACDNVTWGGAEVAVVPPPAGPVEVAPIDEEVGEPGQIPSGPVLHYVWVSDRGAEMVPIGEIDGERMRPLGEGQESDRYWTRFVSERLRQGSEFALFSRGQRVGTFVVSSAELPTPGVCPELPRARGSMELSARAGDIREFLALPKRHEPRTREAIDTVTTQVVNRRMRIVGPILAERMLRARGAGLPGNWQAAMRQAISFPTAGAADLAFSATFLVGDTLGPGLNDEGHSLFFIASPDPGATGYDTTYVRFTDYAREGKAAPRVVDFLDWTRDENSELLLQLYGTRDSWFETLARVGGQWRTTLTVRCANPEQAAAEQAAADSVRRDTVPGSAPAGAEDVPPR